MTREIAIEAIKSMPADFDFDELIEKLVFIEEVEAARKEVKEGNTVSFEEVKKIVNVF